MKKFKKAYVEITNICNRNCSFCPKTTRAPATLSPQNFALLARQIKPFCNCVYLHVMGEPLLHPQLDEILKICEAAELRVIITTNGTLILQQQETLLRATQLYKIHFSLHSFEANKKAMPLAAYVRDIAAFSRKASALGTLCVLRLWNMDNEEIRGENRLNADIIDLLEAEFSSVFSLRNALQQGRTGIRLAPRIYLEMAKKFQWPSLNAPFLGKEVFCYGLRDQFAILCDGTVVPCCLDGEGVINLGNAFKTPLQQILFGARATRIYDGFTARCATEVLCSHCGYATRYHM